MLIYLNGISVFFFIKILIKLEKMSFDSWAQLQKFVNSAGDITKIFYKNNVKLSPNFEQHLCLHFYHAQCVYK